MTDESGSKELHAQIVEWPLVFGGGVRICSHFANLEVSLGVFCTLGHCDCECFNILNSVRPSLTRCLLLYRWVLWADPQQMLGNATKYICRWPEHIIRITHIIYIHIYIYSYNIYDQWNRWAFNIFQHWDWQESHESLGISELRFGGHQCATLWVVLVFGFALVPWPPWPSSSSQDLSSRSSDLSRNAVSCWTESKVQRFLVNIQLWLVYKVRQPWAHLKIFGYFAHLSHNHQWQASKIREALSRQAR